MIKGFAWSRNGPKVTHLLFADYNLLYCKAYLLEAMHIKKILGDYEKTSSQKVIFSKSSVSFTLNIDLYMRRLIENALEVGSDKGLECSWSWK